jgi:hypothetical protein
MDLDVGGWRSSLRVTALMGALMTAPVSVMASPFCVQTQAIPPQCIYVDAASCNARAAQMHGTCTVNPTEARVSPGLGHYCLLTSGQVSACIYASRDDCERDALHQQGVCVDSPGRPESPGPDPYRDVRPLLVGH